MGRDRWGLNKSQRMQMKAYICLLGILLIIVLVLGKLLFFSGRQDEREPGGPAPDVTATPHIPVVRTLTNVWILEQQEDGVILFRDGNREQYLFEGADDAPKGETALYQPETPIQEQLADVELTDGKVTNITVRSEKISGKVLSADESGVEIEGYGKIPLAKDYRGYRLYGGLAVCTAKDLLFGYDNADFCMDNGEICGILMAREEAMESIRVLIKNSNYEGIFHQKLELTSDASYTVIYGEEDSGDRETYAPGEVFSIEADDEHFREGRVFVVPDVLTGRILLDNVGRSQGKPSYRGRMEIISTDQGMVLINQLPLEEYLYQVVPSEMPSGYPTEALKAQAVCARTYAYGHMLHAGYPQYGAHVDDSTSYQVYNNIAEHESTNTAVRETYGQLLYTPDGSLAETYYYSTSCGVGSDETVWKTERMSQIPYLEAKSLSRSSMAREVSAMSDGIEPPKDDIGARLQDEKTFADFITSVNEDDFEAGEGWYRWVYNVEKLDTKHMEEVLKDRYAANEKLILTLENGEYVSKKIGKLGKVKDLYIEKRGAGGVAEELVIVSEGGTYKVISEHNIRYVLNDGKSLVEKQDHSSVQSPTLLPSGFFVIATGKEKGNVVAYTLAGGGFGHGVGMSQNGARQMAQSGFQAGDILLFFYAGCEIRNVYE